MSERPPLPRSPLPLSVSTSGFGVSGFKSGVSGLDSTLSAASVVVVVFASASGFCSGSGSFSPSPTSNIGSNPANSARAFATVLPASTIKESNCLPGFVKVQRQQLLIVLHQGQRMFPGEQQDPT